MFGKIVTGNSFSGCFDYITRKKHDGLPPEKQVWRILGSDGVRLRMGDKGWRKKAVADIERPTLTRSKIKEPCGHISLGFSPDDRSRLTNCLMLQIAEDYMRGMGIVNTPHVIVRHTDKKHPHCHLIFSRIDRNGKIIKSSSNYNRNKDVCEELTKRYGLTWGEDSLSLDPNKLRGSERSRVEIRQIAAEVLTDKSVINWPTFQRKMHECGVKVSTLRDDSTGNMKTLIYKNGRHSFVASKIGSQYTPSALIRIFNQRAEPMEMPPSVSSDERASTVHTAPSITLSSPNLTSAPVEDVGCSVSGGDGETWPEFRARHPELTAKQALDLFRAKKRGKQAGIGGIHM